MFFPLICTLSGGPYLYRSGYRMDTPDNYQTTYNSKTKIVVFYSLSETYMNTDAG